MQRCLRTAALMAMLLLAGAVSASPAAADPPATTAGLPVQLALGDSWPAGVGTSSPSEGYVPQLNAALVEQYTCLPATSGAAAEKCKQLQLVNVAVGGATTPTMIANQFPNAVPLLEDRNGNDNPRDDVEVVTLHIGGNDVTGPIINACLLSGPTPACIQTIQNELAAYQSDLDTALSALRTAAGDDARIVIGTYDNPIPTCQLAAFPGAIQLGALVLEGGGPVPAGLHDIMRDVGADYDVEVAEIFGDLAPTDWVGGTDCLHPDDSGYDKVTDAFLEVLVGS